MYKNKFKNSTAVAHVKGGSDYPDIRGTVTFSQTPSGVLVTAKVSGLPDSGDSDFFAFHIHSGDSCGNPQEAFPDSGVHYNPKNTAHPYHAGDLPPLLSNDGHSYMSVLTNRFHLNDIIGKVIIIHKNPDDFHTQPAGNAGEKIACGKIIR